MAEMLSQGSPYPLGPHANQSGVNFALFSAHAERVELCLFDVEGEREIARLPMPEHNEGVWHGFLPGATAGLRYGYRVHGPYDPRNGHRFNPNKLLIDPYARALDRSFIWNDLFCAYIPGDERQDFSYDTRDSAGVAPKSIVTARNARLPVRQSSKAFDANSVLYELHVRGQTIRNEAIAPVLRGTFGALCDWRMIEHLQRLGITAVELLPIHPIASSRRLFSAGLRDYWGYNSINFFALEPRYLSHGDIDEFRTMLEKFHQAGIEVILDVVFNHTGEGDQSGPTICFRGIDNASYYWLADDKSRYVDFTGCKNTLNFDHPRILQMVIDSLRYWVEEMGVDGFRFDLAVTLAREHYQFKPQGRFFSSVQEDPVLREVKLIAEPWDLGPDGYRLGSFPAPWREWNDKYRDEVRRFWRGDGDLRSFANRLTGSNDIFSAQRGNASINYVTAHDGFTLEDLVSYSQKHNYANAEDNNDGPNENFSANYGAEGPTEDISIGALRKRQRRNLMATLLLSAGTPMLTAGDEFGRTQKGNNNPYCQDNDISWLDWRLAEKGQEFASFVAELCRLRLDSGLAGPVAGPQNAAVTLLCLSPQGWTAMTPEIRDFDRRCLCMQYTHPGATGPLILLLNASDRCISFALPAGSMHKIWRLLLNTAEENPFINRAIRAPAFTLEERTIALLQADP